MCQIHLECVDQPEAREGDFCLIDHVVALNPEPFVSTCVCELVTLTSPTNHDKYLGLMQIRSSTHSEFKKEYRSFLMSIGYSGQMNILPTCTKMTTTGVLVIFV